MIKMELGKGALQPLKKTRLILQDYVAGGQFIREAGEAAVSLVKERTRKGIDASGTPFVPYSAKYREKKGGGVVDLSDSGQMLNDVHFEAKGPLMGTVTVGGSSAERVTVHVSGKGAQPKRDFISIHAGSAEEQKLVRIMREKLARKLKRALR